jgi:hypothetical protein
MAARRRVTAPEVDTSYLPAPSPTPAPTAAQSQQLGPFLILITATDLIIEVP